MLELAPRLEREPEGVEAVHVAVRRVRAAQLRYRQALAETLHEVKASPELCEEVVPRFQTRGQRNLGHVRAVVHAALRRVGEHLESVLDQLETSLDLVAFQRRRETEATLIRVVSAR